MTAEQLAHLHKMTDYPGISEQARAAIAAVLARLEACEKALEPFAGYGRATNMDDEYVICCGEKPVTVGDFRRAALAVRLT